MLEQDGNNPFTSDESDTPDFWDGQNLDIEFDEHGNPKNLDNKLIRGIEKAYEVVNSINAAWWKMAEAAQKVYAEYKPTIEAIRQLTDSFATAIQEWNNSTASEERRQKLIGSYKKWGEYGWTLPPNAPIKSFYTFPGSAVIANEQMMKLCTKKDMEQLFEELRHQMIKQKDLEEAIDCYNDRRYMACALILFGLIDAKLIRKQERKKKRYRPAGSDAAEELRNRFEKESNRTILFIMLRGLNVLYCLESIFENAHDFKKEPFIVNRNFVSHGMTLRSVRRRDCIQLFLALYNLTETLDYIS